MDDNRLANLKEALKNLHVVVKDAGLVGPLLVQVRPVSNQMYGKVLLTI